MLRYSLRLLSICWVVAPLLGQPPAADPQYRALREAQPTESFATENLSLQRDVGSIVLKSGTISFAPPVLDRVTVGVFAGEGEFELAPAVGYERDYLKSITGETGVRESFDRAVFFFTDGSFASLRSAGRAQPAAPRAAEILRDLRQRLRSAEEGENVEAAILADLYNPAQAGFFAAYLHGRRHSDLRFQVRPRGAIPDISPEEVVLINVDPGGDAEGIWYLAHTAGEYAGGRVRGEDKRTVEAVRYRIDTAIGRNENLSGKSEFTFRAVNAGDRVIAFDLLPSLRVSAVRQGSAAVPFIQEDRKKDGGFYVVMPEPVVRGQSYQLTIEYAGDKVVRNAGGGNFTVGARTSWYPSVNAFRDQALYELSFKVPRQYTLVSVGKRLRESRDGDVNVSEWSSEVPIAVAGFNYGQFKRQEIKFDAYPYTVEGFANSGLPDYLKEAGEEIGGMSPARLLDQALSQTQVSLRIFDRYFGRPPYGRIAITQQPQASFGQSWPGLVYLPIISFFDSTQRWRLFGQGAFDLKDFIQEVTPHEVAHQWWGHMVGWNSYRDQWLSEGFADFSAGLFLQATNAKPDKYHKFLEQARDTILEKNNFGRSPNDAGPLYMGLRLSTAKNGGAYARLVYPKGGYVLHMLRMLMWDPQKGDEGFIAMMRDFVQSHLYKAASTESFQAAVEKHMTPGMNLGGNGRMDWYFDQWVYGTEVPRYKLDYQLLPEDGGKVRLKGTLAQSGVSEKFVMGVPLYAEFDARTARLGSARLTGNAAVNIDVVLPQKPRRVSINANFDVLAHK